MYGPDQLLLASKKPHIQELVKRCVDMSDAEIESLPEKSDVIKGLMIIKHLGPGKASVAEKIANKMQVNFREQATQLPVMNIYQYFGPDVYIKVGSSEVLLCTGNYLAFDDASRVIFNNVKSVDPVMSIVKSCTWVQQGTIDDLKQLERSRITKIQI